MRLVTALAVSVLVHAAVALVGLLRREATPIAMAPAAVTATRVALFDVISPASAAAAAPAPVATVAPQRARPLAATANAVEPLEPRAEAPESSPSGAAAADGTEPVAVAVDAPSRAGGATLAAEQPSPAAAGRHSLDVAALHAALAEAAQRCYPPAAKRYHLSGEAQVDFCLDGSGALRSTKLAASTGQALLDAAARECVIAGAMPMPPEAAGGCYSVPVRFGAR